MNFYLQGLCVDGKKWQQFSVNHPLHTDARHVAELCRRSGDSSRQL